MDNSRLAQSLNSIVFAIENPTEHKNKLAKKSRILSIVAWVGFFISFLLYFQNFQGIFIPVLASFSGILYGLSIYLDSVMFYLGTAILLTTVVFFAVNVFFAEAVFFELAFFAVFLVVFRAAIRSGPELRAHLGV